MTLLTAPVRAALSSGRLGHLVTLNPDGSPQVTVIWVGLEDDEIVSGHVPLNQKLRNVRRDPRVSLSFETGGTTHGLDNYLVIEGHARVTEGGAVDLLNRLHDVYVKGSGFPRFADSRPGYVLRIAPTRIRGNGPWSAEAD